MHNAENIPILKCIRHEIKRTMLKYDLFRYDITLKYLKYIPYHDNTYHDSIVDSLLL